MAKDKNLALVMRALKKARAAKAGLTGHEAVCAERYGQMRQSLDRLEKGIGDLRWLVMAGGGSVILFLLGGIGTLAIKLFSH